MRSINCGLEGKALKGQTFKGADLDYSCLPLSCGGLGWNIDIRLASQIAYHFCSMKCADPAFIKARNGLLDLANRFHRAGECGKLVPVEEKPEEAANA
ncbi:MAG: hypothetical protein LBC27_02160 [Spirochaetaceae bacterium]|nr:hypothetical protein [Spirochaetaceae bacterium]